MIGEGFDMFEDKKWDLTFKNRLSRHYDEM